MKNIIVPTDFSATSLKALSYAAEIAQKSGATIYLLHVMVPITDNVGQLYQMNIVNDMLQEETNRSLSELSALKKNVLSIYSSIKIETILLEGTVINSILTFAESKSIDLIVMGTTGASGMKEIFMGSVAAATIAKTIIPVLTVPANYKLEEPDGILFATSHFEEKKEVLTPIVDLANLYGATIHVAVFLDTDDARAADYLLNTRQLLHYIKVLNDMFPNTKFKGELLEGSDFEKAVEKYEEMNELDIIAMIRYPKNLLETILRKSTTRKISFHSTIPLLIIPAQEK